MTAPRVGKLVDVEKLVIRWLNSQLGDAHAADRLPKSIAGRTLWVASAGGSTSYDNALRRVDVQSLVPGARGAAWPLAGDVHGAMRALDGQTVDGQLVNAVRVWSDPEFRFWAETVDRVVATYELDLPVLI